MLTAPILHLKNLFWTLTVTTSTKFRHNLRQEQQVVQSTLMSFQPNKTNSRTTTQQGVTSKISRASLGRIMARFRPSTQDSHTRTRFLTQRAQITRPSCMTSMKGEQNSLTIFSEQKKWILSNTITILATMEEVHQWHSATLRAKISLRKHDQQKQR